MNTRDIYRIFTGMSALFALAQFNMVVALQGPLAIFVNLALAAVLVVQYIRLYMGGDDEPGWICFAQLAALSLAGMSFNSRWKLFLYLAVFFILLSIEYWLKSSKERIVTILVWLSAALSLIGCILILAIRGMAPLVILTILLAAIQAAVIVVSIPKKEPAPKKRR